MNKPTCVTFVNSFCGIFKYLVIGGPMDGKHLKIRLWTKELLRRDWNPKTWNYTSKQYELEVVESSMILHTESNEAVTKDVLDAFNSLYGLREPATTGYYKDGRWHKCEPLDTELPSAVGY